MFDHLSIGVRDLAAAGRFYDALLGPLGHAKTWLRERELAYGSGGARSFWLYPVEGSQIAGLGAHVALRADTKAAVQAAYDAAVELGACTVRAAALHPDIDPDYYGAIILDPDGNKIEIVLSTMH